MTSDDKIREYKQYIPVEHLVTSQIERIMSYRSDKNFEHYEESVDALIDLLAPDSEKDVLEYKNNNNINYDTSHEGIQRYIGLFRYIKSHLAKENIIWKRSRGYDRGHD